jgi:hypothetical protein
VSAWCFVLVVACCRIVPGQRESRLNSRLS